MLFVPRLLDRIEFYALLLPGAAVIGLRLHVDPYFAWFVAVPAAVVNNTSVAPELELPASAPLRSELD